ncbi:BLUF domain-containing protein [Sphingomonas glacialis]|uniref:BLUF domain-containing protein n=1 Tax=Sphingomonas glacialis TaxID=658225 RepID=A0A502FAY7_9SPHN|nr:BLUF domain-containing protein [Sphingomonas glacialis]TPG46566.1 BLUF domain-containing protein [Sphingomonas glacialis]
MAVHTIVYRSVPVFNGSISSYLGEVDSILATARRRNPAANVTGAMLFKEDWFVQLLEGDEGDVQTTFDRIATDPRHEDVELLVNRTVPARQFPDWSMGFVGDAPAVRKRFAESPLAAPGLVLREDEIVDFMVSLARDEASKV